MAHAASRRSPSAGTTSPPRFADLGRNDDAIRACAHAVEIDAERRSGVALRMLGSRTTSARGDYLRAEETLRELIAVRPDSRSARAQLDGLYAAMLADPRWRDDAALARRRAAFASGGSGAGSAAPPAAPASAAAKGAWDFADEARAQFVAALAGQPQGTPAWIAFDGRDPSARAFAKQLAGAFESAGWTVRGIVESPFPLRSGLFVFAADETPSPAAAAATAALEAAHLPATVASGYRDYANDRRRADPNWGGFQLAADQDFLIAVGRPGS